MKSFAEGFVGNLERNGCNLSVPLHSIEFNYFELCGVKIKMVSQLFASESSRGKVGKAMKSCIDPKVGKFVTAYHLGEILKDSDKEYFEAHLLECDFCWKKFERLEKEEARQNLKSD
jgi:hypothetical protein